VRIDPPLTVIRTLGTRYLNDPDLLSVIGKTKPEMRKIFKSKQLTDAFFTPEMKQKIEQHYKDTRKGVDIVRPTIMTSETRASQMLEQVKGIKTQLENLRLRTEQQQSRESITQQLLNYSRSLDDASLDVLKTKFSTVQTQLSVPQRSVPRTKRDLKDKLMEYEKGRLEGVYKQIDNLADLAQRQMITRFRDRYESLSDADKTTERLSLLKTVSDYMAVPEDDVATQLGGDDIDDLLDFAKSHALPLPGQSLMQAIVGVPQVPFQPTVDDQPPDVDQPPPLEEA
jgi:hypothetical protein